MLSPITNERTTAALEALKVRFEAGNVQPVKVQGIQNSRFITVKLTANARQNTKEGGKAVFLTGTVIEDVVNGLVGKTVVLTVGKNERSAALVSGSLVNASVVIPNVIRETSYYGSPEIALLSEYAELRYDPELGATGKLVVHRGWKGAPLDNVYSKEVAEA